jgi:methylphosphotriester-DNA--protein-cysteine methyltransferase
MHMVDASNDGPQKILPLARAARPSTSAAARWQAVVNRDPTANTFVYAVLTTKIYCRPSCPARLARRANVRFYDTPSQAESAGFRPCKRCKPETHWAANPQVQLIQKTCEIINLEVLNGCKPTLQKLASEANLTPSHFHRIFKKVMGVTPGQYSAAALGYRNRNSSIDSGLSEDSIVNQPLCGDDVGHDPCPFGGLDHCPASTTNDAVVWNEFDAMLAAENEFILWPEEVQ